MLNCKKRIYRYEGYGQQSDLLLRDIINTLFNACPGVEYDSMTNPCNIMLASTCN